MRVVLDTNVLISAVVYGGHPREILEAATAGTITIFISDALLEEFQGVLQRPQFALTAEFVQARRAWSRSLSRQRTTA